MYRQHFGLKHEPLGKDHHDLWDDGTLATIKERFQWLLDSPGIGLITGEPGVGKTAALHTLIRSLNPHRYKMIYMSETDFCRLDLYRQLAVALGIEPSYRRAQIWHELKTHIQDMVDAKNVQLIWIIDEAQNLPTEFFRDFPAFLNFAFDSRDLMTVWLVGHPYLSVILDRAPYAALKSRIRVKMQLKPIIERERFAQMIHHALKSAGCSQTLLSESGLELLRQASRGIPRDAGRILCLTMQLAVPKGFNHLPDTLLQQAIEEWR